MVAGFKKYRALCMLECTHSVLYHVEYPHRVPPDFIPCPQCNCDVALYAVECREWKTRCIQCRYSRWSGQSKKSAEELKARHWQSTGHPEISVRYQVHPDKFQSVRNAYRRSIQFRIDGTPRIPIARKRNVGPDIPPF